MGAAVAVSARGGEGGGGGGGAGRGAPHRAALVLFCFLFFQEKLDCS